MTVECGLCVLPSLPKSNRMHVYCITMCTFIIINVVRRQHFISRFTHTNCMHVGRKPVPFFDAINYRPKNLWRKIAESDQPAMTRQQSVHRMFVCLRAACGARVIHVEATTTTTTTTSNNKNDEEKETNMGQFLNFP